LKLQLIYLVVITALVSAFITLLIEREVKKPELATLNISRVMSYVKTRVKERTENLPESEKMKKTEELYPSYLAKAREAIFLVSQGRTVLVEEAVIVSPKEVEDITNEVLAQITD